MNNIPKPALKSFLAAALLGPLAPALHAWQPNANDLDAAVKTADFKGYLSDATSWLNQKTPARPDTAAMIKLLQDPLVLMALDQRQLIAKTGADQLAAFAKADPANQAFLSYLLKNTAAMELYLEGSVPIGLAAREENKYPLPVAALEIWRKILAADPDAKDGIYQKMAIATAIAPPGSVNIGAGGAKTPAEPVTRYKYYKTAHRNKELFPSFDHLTVWEYTKIVYSGASDSDLTWAREMVNTFQPNLRVDEMVVNSTSFVWRRNSPIPFEGTFKNVLAGGGKCGPRSSWSQMVCHAFGIPAIGVGQPAHACVAYKAANPMTEPQPGSAWKVGFGRGWPFSKLEGLQGPDFLAGVQERSRATDFSKVEHLRWLASALTTPASAAAIMEIAHKVQQSAPASKTDLTASLKPDEAEADPGVKAGAKPPVGNQAEVANATVVAPVKAVAGEMHVEAASFAKTGGEISWGGQFPQVLVHDCFTGGKQVYFQQQMKSQWADYTLEVATAGTYQITMKAAVVNEDQVLEICSGTNVIATVPIPLSYGLWETTQPVELKLDKGVQTLRVQTPTSELKRCIALRAFDIKSK